MEKQTPNNLPEQVRYEYKYTVKHPFLISKNRKGRQHE